MNKVYEFMDEIGTNEFIRTILEIIDLYFDKRLVSADTDESELTNENMYSCKESLSLTTRICQIVDELTGSVNTAMDMMKSIYGDAIMEGFQRIHGETVIGDITTVENPDSYYIYFQKDSLEDDTWVMYIWNDDWLPVGETKYDLLNYWNDDNLSELKNKIVVAMDERTVRTKVQDEFDKKK